MKMLLQAISNTESRDPRDASATATMLLNLCFSSCRDPSTATLLAVHTTRMVPSAPQVFSRFCTDPVMALLWQHANNSPRECSDAMIASLDDEALRGIFGRNVTTCVLKTLLPAYVALCDARAIQCEETMLAIPSVELDACKNVYEASRTCSPQCAALANQLATGGRCFESLWSVQEAIAHAANQTCGDSGECVTSSCFHLCNTSIQRLSFAMRPKRANGAVKFPVRCPHQPSRCKLLTLSSGLNAKCNLSTPYPSNLPGAQGIFDSAWASTRISGNQPAGLALAFIE